MALRRSPVLFQSAREELYRRFRDRLEVNAALSRGLVSYQANRNRRFYRWFKYKEGFSAALVAYVLDQLGTRGGQILDPFAGTGAALMVARERGLAAVGIELMPIGPMVVRARLAADRVDRAAFLEACESFDRGRWKVRPRQEFSFPHLRITQGAFPKETEESLNQFRTFLRTAELDPDVRILLDLACLSVLEAISYTRKDGQYLRWDHRAPRELTGKTFDKGPLPTFEQAMRRQLRIMKQDLTARELLPTEPGDCPELRILEGSCLELLPSLGGGQFDVVITSPPYCNRYDYTRTYALELAYLGIDEAHLKSLRQSLLSCTVENHSKVEQLRAEYTRRGNVALFDSAMDAFSKQEALQEVLTRLDELARRKRLNNPNIPRMVRNYFIESAVVIFELARIVRPGGSVVMVNDNVQYGGEEVPVVLILSDIAESAGFVTKRIWVLPRGKGNSSQQMGRHGRKELRKCVYLWCKS